MAMTRTIAAARRNARRTSTWNSEGHRARGEHGDDDRGERRKTVVLSFRSTNAMYAAKVPIAPCAKLTRPEPR